MATNRSIRGLSGRGFRVPNSSGVLKTVKESTTTLVNVDDTKTALILSREKDNFVRVPDAGTFTVSIASPAVVSKVAHGFVAGDIVVFSTTGALPTGLTAGTKYYVIAAGLAADSFRVSATYGGSAVNTSGTQSGVHTVTAGSAKLVGLSKVGFRIRSYQATSGYAVVKNGPAAAVVTVDLNDGRVRRVLKRNYGRYVASSSLTSVTIRGLQEKQNGFEITASSENADTATITQAGANATNNKVVTINGRVYTLKSALTEVKATAVLTSDNTEVVDGDTVTVNGTVYRFKNTMAQANDVKRSGTVDTTLANLAAAINQSGTPGTEYYAGTTAPAGTGITAGAVTAHAITLTATVPGTAGNAFTKAESSIHLSFDGGGGGTTFSGGVAPVADQVKIGGSAAATLASLVKAINATGTAGTDYSTGTTVNVDVTAVLTSATVATLKGVSGGTQEITVSTDEPTYTVAGAQLSDPLAKLYKLVSATVNPADEKVFTQLRRHFKSWIEV